MKFADFLKESEDNNVDIVELSDSLDYILKTLKSDSKRLKIFLIDFLYVLDYKDESDPVETEDIAGYFVYKKNLDEQDDYFISKFIFNVSNKTLDVNIDKNDDTSYSTIADAELKLKKLKTLKVEI